MITQIRQLYVEVTTVCNLQCSYCYNQTLVRKNDQRLVEKLEEFFHKFYSIISPELKITLHGGEALLFPEKIQAIRQTVLQYIPQASFNIQTNGRNLHLPEVQALLAGMDRTFITIGFDSTFKRPQELNFWTSKFLKHNDKVSFNYLILEKGDIEKLAENVNFIYDTYNNFPTINYNFFKTHELSSVYREIQQQIGKIRYSPQKVSTDISIDSCGEVVLQNDGIFRGCQSKIFHHSTMTLEGAQLFYNGHCPHCEYKNYCIACPIRIANYQGQLCYLTKALVDGSK